MTVSTRKTEISERCGRANPRHPAERPTVDRLLTTVRSDRRWRQAGPLPCTPRHQVLRTFGVAPCGVLVTTHGGSGSVAGAASGPGRARGSDAPAPRAPGAAARRGLALLPLEQPLRLGDRAGQGGGQGARPGLRRWRRGRRRGRSVSASPIATASSAATIRAVAQISSALGVANALDQRLCSRQVGHQPERGLLHAEQHVVGHHPQVAAERQLEAGADRVAVDRGHRHEARVAQEGEAALVGRRWCRPSPRRRARAAPPRSRRPRGPAGSSMLRSRPAEELGPLPADDDHPDLVAEVAPRRRPGPATSPGVCALRTSGRSRVRVATGPTTSRSRPASARVTELSGVMGGASVGTAADSRRAARRGPAVRPARPGRRTSRSRGPRHRRAGAAPGPARGRARRPRRASPG